MTQYVFVVDDGTRKYIEIAEGSGQQQIRKITLTLEDAVEVLDQLRQKLHEAGVR